MAKPDLYTVTQAAKILGLSVKRVRQMIEEGKLTAYSVGPVKLKQLDILAMRNEREASGKGVQSDKGAATNTEVLLALRGLSDTFSKQLEAVTDSNRRNEENYLQQINQLRAENETLRLAQSKKRGLFRR
jgi:excisionase family DNA binding protein